MTAWKGVEPDRSLARRLLLDRSRIFVGSRLLHLEVIPKPTFHKREPEILFYERIFGVVAEWVPIDDDLIQSAIDLGCKHDIQSVDALHVAAALAASVDEFVSYEKPTKPMYKVSQINPKYLLTIFDATR